MSKQKKLLLLWDRMGDYHRARWKATQQLLGAERCLAADLGGGDGLYSWNNTAESNLYFRLSEQPVDKVPFNEAFKRFKEIIKTNKITHVAIPGYGRPIYIAMLIWCRLKGIKVLMFAESWYKGNFIFDFLKGVLLRSTVDVCLVSGKRASRHFNERLGLPLSRIVEGYSVVDNSHFSSAINTVKADPPQLLCVARFAPVKNLVMLIDAFQKSQLSKSWQLRIVGGGPDRKQLETSISIPNIKLDNWLSYDRLPQMYSQATCFILPSSFEPWGLVVNEAMAASLPVIISDAVGALPDLLAEDVNGWIFDAKKQEDLVKILNLVADQSNSRLIEMGFASKEIVESFTPYTWAKSVGEWMER